MTAARHPLTAAQRTALVLRDNSRSPFCVAFSRNTPGINTEPRADKDKTHALKRGTI